MFFWDIHTLDIVMIRTWLGHAFMSNESKDESGRPLSVEMSLWSEGRKESLLQTSFASMGCSRDHRPRIKCDIKVLPMISGLFLSV